jgi:transcriptional regulator with XRE-family HTH domain
MSFGRHLQELREAAGQSRAALARLAGVPASTLRNWESDRDFPGPPAFLRLAGPQGVSPERLAEGVEDPAEDEELAAQEEARRAGRGRPHDNCYPRTQDADTKGRARPPWRLWP